MLPPVESWRSPIDLSGEVRVFQVDLSPHKAREDEALAWLDKRERGRRDRFGSPGPRRRFTLCRAALRSILCRELGCRNDELGFGVSYYEKPFAIVQGESHPVCFNVSHSGKRGLIGIADRGRVGVDLEEIDSQRNIELLVDSAFTPAERTVLNLVEEARRHHLFFRFWTIKEALIKGVGMGLSLDMTTFEIPLKMRRGASSAVFSFPQVPSINWKLDSIVNGDYCAAIVHEIDSPSSQYLNNGTSSS